MSKKTIQVLNAILKARKHVFTVLLLLVMVFATTALNNGFHRIQSAADATVQSDVKSAATTIQAWVDANPSTVVRGKKLNKFLTDSGILATGIKANKVVDDEDTETEILSFSFATGTTYVVKPGSKIGTFTVCGFGFDAESGLGSDKTGSPASAVVYDSSSGETETGVPCP